MTSELVWWDRDDAIYTVGTDAIDILEAVECMRPAEPNTEAIVDILVSMLDEYDYRGRNLDFGEYAGRIAATWKNTK